MEPVDIIHDIDIVTSPTTDDEPNSCSVSSSSSGNDSDDAVIPKIDIDIHGCEHTDLAIDEKVFSSRSIDMKSITSTKPLIHSTRLMKDPLKFLAENTNSMYLSFSDIAKTTALTLGMVNLYRQWTLEPLYSQCCRMSLLWLRRSRRELTIALKTLANYIHTNEIDRLCTVDLMKQTFSVYDQANPRCCSSTSTAGIKRELGDGMTPLTTGDVRYLMNACIGTVAVPTAVQITMQHQFVKMRRRIRLIMLEFLKLKKHDPLKLLPKDDIKDLLHITQNKPHESRYLPPYTRSDAALYICTELLDACDTCFWLSLDHWHIIANSLGQLLAIERTL
jgi:hypothetical protein